MTNLFFNYYQNVKGAQLRNFELFWIRTETPVNERKPEDSIVLRWKKEERQLRIEKINKDYKKQT